MGVAADVPVPLRVSVCGELAALSLMDKDAAREFADVGVNVTEMVQVLPAATLLVQPVALKSAGFVPESCREVIKRAALPVLVTVIVWVALVPTDWLPKLKLVGERLTCGSETTAMLVRLKAPEDRPVAEAETE